MSVFTVNYSEAGGFEPVAPGNYEAVISKVEVTQSQSGNPMLKVQLTIRNDVEQDFQKRKVFDNLVQSERSVFRLQQVAKAVQIPDGTPINTLADLAREIQFKPVRVKIKHEMYNKSPATNCLIAPTIVPQHNEPQAKVAFYDVAQFPYSGGGEAASPFSVPGDASVDFSDDDLPF